MTITKGEVLAILAELGPVAPDPQKGELTVAEAARSWNCTQEAAYLRLKKLHGRGLFSKRRWRRVAVFAPRPHCTPKALRAALQEMFGGAGTGPKRERAESRRQA